MMMSRTESELRVELNEAITNGDLDRASLALNELSTIASSPPPSEAVVLATEIGSLPIVNLLLFRGADVPDYPVCVACTPAKIEFLQAFLDSGRWDVKLSFGGHIGDILTFTIRPAVIQWALDHGADPNKNRDGGLYYPLERAVSGHNLDCAKVPISGGAHVMNAYALVIRGSTAIIGLESGADINEIPPDEYYNRGPFQRTPLHEAAKEGHLEVVHLLLDHGSDAFSTDTDGKKPVGLARASDHISVVNMLEGHL